MKQHTKLSGVIITFNEEKNIARCIDSLMNVTDEIIVVDSFSTDRTEAICKEKNATFIQNKFDGHIEQKNFAMRQAKFDYVLSLDADEALSPELEKAIQQEKTDFKYDGYRFNRLTSYCGQWIKHCGWYPDTKLRIWNKTRGEWKGENPHDTLVMQGSTEVKNLNGDLLHYSFTSVNQHVKTIQSFSEIGARAAFKRGKRSSVFSIVVNPSFKFIRDNIFKAGFLDGYYGLIVCLNSAYATFLKYTLIYELQRSSKNTSSQ